MIHARYIVFATIALSTLHLNASEADQKENIIYEDPLSACAALDDIFDDAAGIQGQLDALSTVKDPNTKPIGATTTSQEQLTAKLAILEKQKCKLGKLLSEFDYSKFPPAQQLEPSLDDRNQNNPNPPIAVGFINNKKNVAARRVYAKIFNRKHDIPQIDFFVEKERTSKQFRHGYIFSISQKNSRPSSPQNWFPGNFPD